MSQGVPKLNQVGMPPPGRTIHRRREELDTETEADAAGDEAAGSRNSLVMSIVAFVAVVILGLALAWLVL